jgi:hypothetical protein
MKRKVKNMDEHIEILDFNKFISTPPEDIIQAINNNRFAIFFGNGLSRLVGVESYDILISTLTKRLELEGRIDQKTKKEIDLYPEKSAMTICRRLYRRFKMEEIYHLEKGKYLLEEQPPSTPNLYDKVYKLRGFFITTNVDTHFDRFFDEDNILYKLEHFRAENLNPDKLSKIHGSEVEPQSEVFTHEEYRIQYDNADFLDYLNAIFKDFTVLIIGTDFEEDLLIQKLPNLDEDIVYNRYILLNSRSEADIFAKQALCEAKKLIPIFYDVSDNDWSKLIDIISSWITEINERSDFYFNFFKRIDKFVTNPTDEEYVNIFQYVKNDITINNYFYGNISNCENPYKLLPILEKHGCFHISNNPPPVKDDNSHIIGYPYWRILDYLINLAKYSDLKTIEAKVCKEIKEFINNFLINIFQEKDKKWIQNLNSNQEFIKLMEYLPINIISKNHIDFIKEYYQLVISEDFRLKGQSFHFFPSKIIQNLVQTFHLNDNEEMTIYLSEVILDVKYSFPLNFIFEENQNFEKKYIKNEKKMEYLIFRAEISNILRNYSFRFRHFKKILDNVIIKYANHFLSYLVNVIKEYETKIESSFVSLFSIQKLINRDLYSEEILLLCDLVMDLIHIFNSESIEIKINIVEQFLKSKYIMMQKIAIYLINFNYRIFSSFFWELEYNPLENLRLKPDIIRLIQNNSHFLEKEEIMKYLQWIDSIKLPLLKKNAKDELSLIHYKRKFIHPIRNRRFKKLRELMQSLDRKDNSEISNPADEIEIGDVKIGFGKSPLSLYQMEKIPFINLIGYLNSFKEEEDAWLLDKPTLRGLLEVFGNYVMKNQNLIIENLSIFISLNPDFLKEILYKMRIDQFKLQKGNIVYFKKYFRDIFSNEDLWKNISYEWNNQREIINLSLDLFWKALFQKDIRSNHKEIFELISIFKLCIANMEKKFDFSNYSIEKRANFLVKYFRILIISILITKDFKSDSKVNKLQSELIEILVFYIKDDKYTSPELFYSIGRNISELNACFDLPKELEFQAFFEIQEKYILKNIYEGYIHTSFFNEHNFRLFWKNEHLKKTIQQFTDNNNSRVVIRKVICFIFKKSEGDHELKEFLNYIFSIFTEEYLSTFSWMVWKFSKTWFGSEDQYNEKLLFLINSIIENYNSKGKISYLQKSAIYLCLWIELVDEIDSQMLYFLQIILDYPISTMSSPILGHLNDFIDDYPQEIGDLVVKIIKNNPSLYLSNEILVFIEKMFELNIIEQAKRICNIFFQKSNPIKLKELYEKYV